MRLRRVVTSIAALLLVAGGVGAAAAEPGKTPEDAVSSVQAQPIEVSSEVQAPSGDKPRVIPGKTFDNEKGDCAQVRKKENLDKLARRGEKTASCFEWQSKEELRKQDRTARKVMGAKSADAVWCKDAAANAVIATRTELCSHRGLVFTVVDTTHGVIVGTAVGTVDQEITLSTTETMFDESFRVTISETEGFVMGGLAIDLIGTCMGVDDCKQGTGPWTGPQPIAAGSTLEGHIQRSWKKNTGKSMLYPQYDLVMTVPGAVGNVSWGELDYEIRCDNSVGTYAGCVVPSYVPTLEVDYKKYPAASDYINDAQWAIKSHPGLEGEGEPLTREGDEAVAKANRKIVCDSTFKKEDNFNGKYKLECDEFPFAATKESGAQLGIKSGSECKQFAANPPVASGEPSRNHNMYTRSGVQGKANCARSSMINTENQGVGGDLGRFTKTWRMLDGDGFWVKALSWTDACGCTG